MYHAKLKQKKAVVALLISDKVGFRRNRMRCGIAHYIMMKRLIHHENWNLSRKLKAYVTRYRVSEYIKQKLMEPQGELYKYTIIVGDCNTLSSVTGRIS